MQEIADEMRKCQESPYYFAVKYMKIGREGGESVKFEEIIDEKEFNDEFWYFNPELRV